MRTLGLLGNEHGWKKNLRSRRCPQRSCERMRSLTCLKTTYGIVENKASGRGLTIEKKGRPEKVIGIEMKRRASWIQRGVVEQTGDWN